MARAWPCIHAFASFIKTVAAKESHVGMLTSRQIQPFSLPKIAPEAAFLGNLDLTPLSLYRRVELRSPCMHSCMEAAERHANKACE
eukprot:349632-Chlamydomonas_euryale.AAC.53